MERHEEVSTWSGRPAAGLGHVPTTLGQPSKPKVQRGRLIPATGETPSGPDVSNRATWLKVCRPHFGKGRSRFINKTGRRGGRPDTVRRRSFVGRKYGASRRPARDRPPHSRRSPGPPWVVDLGQVAIGQRFGDDGGSAGPKGDEAGREGARGSAAGPCRCGTSTAGLLKSGPLRTEEPGGGRGAGGRIAGAGGSLKIQSKRVPGCTSTIRGHAYTDGRRGRPPGPKGRRRWWRPAVHRVISRRAGRGVTAASRAAAALLWSRAGGRRLGRRTGRGGTPLRTRFQGRQKPGRQTPRDNDRPRQTPCRGYLPVLGPPAIRQGRSRRGTR